MNSQVDPASPLTSSNADSELISRPDRPCDTCRRRKSRCVIKPGLATCVLCDFHKQSCTFEEQPAPRAKRKSGVEPSRDFKRRSLSERPRAVERFVPGRTSVHDYADLEGVSLLKTTRKCIYGLSSVHANSVQSVYKTIGMLSMSDHQQSTISKFSHCDLSTKRELRTTASMAPFAK